jgi:hypothetical protein
MTHLDRREVFPLDSHQAMLDRMVAQITSWQEAGDSRSLFLECYRMMTQNMLQAIQDGEFHDSQWVENLVDHFAGYYFTALDAYQKDPALSPAAWHLAFDKAADNRLLTIQNLLLGVNAHISYDLTLALGDLLEPDWAGLDETGRRQRYEDHSHVNRVIGRTIDAVQDTLIEPHEPSMDLLDHLLGPIDEWLISNLIDRWRDEVWEQAVQRVETSSQDERERLRLKAENEALQRARYILLDL